MKSCRSCVFSNWRYLKRSYIYLCNKRILSNFSLSPCKKCCYQEVGRCCAGTLHFCLPEEVDALQSTMDNELVYPNLVNCQIATKSSNLSSLPPPPPSSAALLKRIDESGSYQKPSIEKYKFTVEREVLERARERNKDKEEEHQKN